MAITQLTETSQRLWPVSQSPKDQPSNGGAPNHYQQSPLFQYPPHEGEGKGEGEGEGYLADSAAIKPCCAQGSA